MNFLDQLTSSSMEGKRAVGGRASGEEGLSAPRSQYRTQWGAVTGQ